MSKVVVINNVTLDGVMEAPQHWATKPNEDPVIARAMADRIARSGPLLLGRRTYEEFYAYWPKQHGSPFKEVLDNQHKYVASRTLEAPLPWQNSTLLPGDAAGAVANLKERDNGGDIAILGSGMLIRSLMERGLIDELVLLIQPVVLGDGFRLFADGGSAASVTLVDTVTADSGVIVATYRVG